MHVHIPGHLKAFIEREVAAGHYPDETAVIADALERLVDEDDTRPTVAEAVAEALAQMERGEGIEVTDDFWESLRADAEDDFRNGVPVSDDIKY